MKTRRDIALWKVSCSVAALMALATGASARQYAPRVISPHNADAYSMKTFAQFPRWQELNGDAKFYEIYRYLSDQRTGIYPLGVGAAEGKDAGYEFRIVRDPVKMINVYAVGYCDALGPTFAGILQDMGVGPARTINIPGLSHVAAEVFYDGKWHYGDLDLRLIFRRPDGSLGSAEESRTDPACWSETKSAWWLPCDVPAGTRRGYEKGGFPYRYNVGTGGHTMDYVLRRGETFTRWWKPQGARWNMVSEYLVTPFPKNLFEKSPRGPKCKHGRNYTVHTSGNGLYVYQPDLTSKSADFADGVYDSGNVKPGPNGLTLDKAGEGYAVFEVRTPYVIVPEVGKMETTADDRDASVVTVDASGATFAMSLDNGLTWKDIGTLEKPADLTPEVHGTYGYLLKATLKGEPEKSILKSLQMKTWVELHPASLPGLRNGTNVMQYVTGDHYGLPTRVMEISTDGSDRDDFLKYCSEPPKDFDPARFKTRAVGAFVVKVQSPPHSEIAWFSGGGSFCSWQADDGPGKDSTQTKNSMAHAANSPKGFKEFYKAALPSGNDHWHYNADVEVRLKKPSKAVYIRYVGDPGVNNLRIYAHCLDDRPQTPDPVIITHAWTEKGAAKSKTVTLEKPGQYEIVAAHDPVDVSIAISVPSSRKQ